MQVVSAPLDNRDFFLDVVEMVIEFHAVTSHLLRGRVERGVVELHAG